jgi:methylated-DNA-protein-cysteine methyltransferase-like protein
MMSVVPAEFRERVIAVVVALAAGEVVSYGDVAAQAGYPGAARGVGAVLAHCDDPLPWWRVVMSSGRLAPGKEARQAQLLRAEGVTVRAGRVVR